MNINSWWVVGTEKPPQSMLRRSQTPALMLAVGLDGM